MTRPLFLKLFDISYTYYFETETHAKNWGSRTIAVHCNIKVPEGAECPQPKTSKDIDSQFMVKLLYTQKAK